MAKEERDFGKDSRSGEVQQSDFSEHSNSMGLDYGYTKRGHCLFINTLTESALQVFKKVARLSLISEFYLAGGSAAALYLGHRVSVDLDFFTEHESFNSELLIQSIQSVGDLKIQQQSRRTLIGLLDNVQISFFTYPYALLEAPVYLEGIRIAGLLDISLMKIIAISQRGKMRDFVDLYFLCRDKYSLEELLNSVPRKYPTVTYPSYHLLRSLAYFADAEDDVPPRSLIDWDWEEVKEFFAHEVKGIMQRMV